MNVTKSIPDLKNVNRKDLESRIMEALNGKIEDPYKKKKSSEEEESESASDEEEDAGEDEEGHPKRKPKKLPNPKLREKLKKKPRKNLKKKMKMKSIPMQDQGSKQKKLKN